jgi:hypothetical protein
MMFSNYCWAVAGKSIFIRGHFRPILQAMQRHSKSLAFGRRSRAAFRQGLGHSRLIGFGKRLRDYRHSVISSKPAASAKTGVDRCSRLAVYDPVDLWKENENLVDRDQALMWLWAEPR